MKKNRIVSTIFFILTAIVEVFALIIYFGSIIPAIQSSGAAAISTIVLLPLYLLVTGLVAIGSIIILFSTLRLFSKLKKENLKKSPLDFCFLFAPIAFVVFNIILILII